MPLLNVLGAEGETTFSIAESLSKVTTSFGTAMKDVAQSGLGLIGDALPFIVAVVGAGVLVGFGIKWVKKIRG